MTSIPTPVFGFPHAATVANASTRTMRPSTLADLQGRADCRSAARVVDHGEHQAVVVAPNRLPRVVAHVPGQPHRCGRSGDGAYWIDREVSHRGGPMEAARLDIGVERPAQRTGGRDEWHGHANRVADGVVALHADLDPTLRPGRREHQIPGPRRG